jgi:pimeloyl-ACP methyl ester carboxylesterase
VLLHGYLMSHQVFGPLLEPKDREVIALDLPGFGRSDCPPTHLFSYAASAMAEVVGDALAALGVSRCVLLGHSFGGSIALTLAARAPGLIERLVIVSGSLDRLAWPRRLDPLMRRRRLGPLLFRYGLSRWLLGRRLKREFPGAPERFEEALADRAWRELQRPGGHRAAHAVLLRIAEQADGDPAPRAIRAPTLLVWGAEDRLVPLVHGERLATELSHARLEVIPSAGHFPYLERPDECLRRLTPFLAP